MAAGATRSTLGSGSLAAAGKYYAPGCTVIGQVGGEALVLDPGVTKPIYQEMVDASGNPVTCDNVWISYFTGGRDNMGEGYGKLTAG